MTFETSSRTTLWQGTCKFYREAGCPFQLVHEDAWQDPVTLLPEETRRQIQVLSHLSEEHSHERDRPQNLNLNARAREYFTF